MELDTQQMETQFMALQDAYSIVKAQAARQKQISEMLQKRMGILIKELNQFVDMDYINKIMNEEETDVSASEPKREDK